jgi:hypothetical protein
MALTGRDSCAFHFQAELDQAADGLRTREIGLVLFFNPGVYCGRLIREHAQVNRFRARRGTAS